MSPSRFNPKANSRAARIGPMVWELEGPMPTLKMSKTLKLMRHLWAARARAPCRAPSGSLHPWRTPRVDLRRPQAAQKRPARGQRRRAWAKLGARLARFLGTEDVILYSSCFDANGGLFETLLDERDAVISDALNHASIIDGIRLCKAQRYRYANSDMHELEQCLKQSSTARTRLIATDGVFSMDGFIAKLAEICDLASRYDALVMVDDSHATGFMGATGRGTPEHCGVAERVDILTGTLGKALGGGTGGYVAAPRELIEWLRQRSRPYLFSNSIPPVVAAASLAVLDLLDRTPQLRAQLLENTRFFRSGLESAGFDLKPGEHPIIPVMIGDAALAARMADRLLERGVYVIGFSYPVVPKGQARIRTQMSASLARGQLEQALGAFREVGRELGVLKGRP